MATIPRYLDNFIFDELGGFYQPGLNVDLNLKNDEQANKRYIGTYFPRSLVECYQLLHELYAHKIIKTSIDNKESLKILDVGTGTGGNMLGLMHFLKKINFNKEVEIFSMEGNKNSIEYQIKFFKKFNSEFRTNYRLRYSEITFSTDSLCSSLSSFISQRKIKFDIITSFKFISEFYNTDYENAVNNKLFRSFANTLSNFLTDDGIMIILDLVSGNYDHSKRRLFTTQIISNELNEVVKNNNFNLRYILPICCGFWSNRCNTRDCYIERHFFVTHRSCQNDILKVAYRVLVPTSFASKILADLEEKERYQMSYNLRYPKLCENTRTIEVTQEQELPNAFKFI